MSLILLLLSVFGLSFLVKESDGPWGIMAWTRNKLITNKYVGVFFFNLLNCYFCTGCWAGWTIYLLTQECYKFNTMLVWGLAGGAASLILSALLTWLHRE